MTREQLLDRDEELCRLICETEDEDEYATLMAEKAEIEAELLWGG